MKNVILKSALKECADASKSLNCSVKETIAVTAKKEIIDVFGELADIGWKKLIEQSVYTKCFMAGAKAGTWIGDSVCNILFSTDKTIEQYYKMKCMNEIHSLLIGSVNNFKNVYIDNRNTRNAENYIAAIDVLFSSADLNCEFALDYGKILYEDAALGWTGDMKTYDEYKTNIESIRKIYKSEYSSLFKNYMATMETEYPDIYDVLTSKKSEYSFTYLDQFNPIETDRYTGNMGDSYIKANWGTISSINGYKSDHSLTAWIARWNFCEEYSWAYAVYDIDGKYNTLFGRMDLIKSNNLDSFNTKIQFIGDGELLDEYIMTPDNMPFDIIVDVRNVKKLKVYVYDIESSARGTLFGLFDFRLTSDNKTDKNIIFNDSNKECIGIKCGATILRLKSKINSNIIITDKYYEVLDDEHRVATGDKVFVKDEKGDIQGIYSVCIKGDVDGTGTIDVLDMEAIQKSILGIDEILSGVYMEAALLCGDSKDISVLDMEVIQKDILGIQKIN